MGAPKKTVASLEITSAQSSRPQLTPRSSEACRRTGVDPRELVPLPPEVFKEPGQSEELQQLKFHHYEQGRLETFKMVQDERERIMREASRGALRSCGASGGVGKDAEAALLAQSDAASSSVYLREKRILEKIQKRQQADIQNMLMFELKSAQISEEKEEKVRQMAERAEGLRREKERKSRVWAEERRRWDDEKHKQELMMEKDARRRQQLELQREARKKAEEELQAKRLSDELGKKEEERVAKQEARRQRQSEVMQERQRQAAIKAEEDARREELRTQKYEEQRQAREARNAALREKGAQRVSDTLAQQARSVEEQRVFYAHRMALEEQRSELLKEQRLLDLKRRKQRGQERANHIRGVQGSMEQISDGAKRAVLDKERKHDGLMRQVEMDRHEETMRAQTEKDMRMYQRQMAMARNQRRDEYRREVTSEKIRMETQRADDLKQRRQDMLFERRTMRNQSVTTRQLLVDKIDKMRQSNSFYLPPSMRTQIENPELIELMERCDETGAEMGGGKVTMQVMKHIMQQMQSEGKLQEMLPGHKKRGGSSTTLARPATAPQLGGDASPL